MPVPRRVRSSNSSTGSMLIAARATPASVTSTCRTQARPRPRLARARLLSGCILLRLRAVLTAQPLDLGHDPGRHQAADQLRVAGARAPLPFRRDLRRNRVNDQAVLLHGCNGLVLERPDAGLQP